MRISVLPKLFILRQGSVPPASVVEGIKSVLCIRLCVCLSVSALPAEPFDIRTLNLVEGLTFQTKSISQFSSCHFRDASHPKNPRRLTHSNRKSKRQHLNSWIFRPIQGSSCNFVFLYLRSAVNPWAGNIFYIFSHILFTFLASLEQISTFGITYIFAIYYKLFQIQMGILISNY